jgi:nitrogen fixation protein FixH
MISRRFNVFAVLTVVIITVLLVSMVNAEDITSASLARNESTVTRQFNSSQGNVAVTGELSPGLQNQSITGNQTNVTVTATPTATPSVTGETTNVTSTESPTVTETTVVTVTLTPTVVPTSATDPFLKPGTDLVPYNEINYPLNESNDPFTAYDANLTYPWNQLNSPAILLFLDPNYPVFSRGPSREEQIELYIKEKTVVPAAQAAARFNITNTSGKPIGDQLMLDIAIYPGNSTHIVDPYITSVVDREDDYNAIVAWVDVNNIGSLATLNGVQKFHFIQRLGTFSGGKNAAGPVTTTGMPPQKTPVTSATTKAGIELGLPIVAALLGCVLAMLSRDRLCR